MNRLACTASLLMGFSAVWPVPASAQPYVPPGVARALGTPLNYISGRPGDETLLAFRNVGGSGLFFHKDRLYLQFRKGRLTGWKGDWGHNWMWQ